MANTAPFNGTSTQPDLHRESHAMSLSCNPPSTHENGNSRRPKSAMFVPNGCLPPPIGFQLIANGIKQAQRQSHAPHFTEPKTVMTVGSRALPNGTTLESFVAPVQQQPQQRHSRSRQLNQRQQSSGDSNRPPVSVRPPRPPLRTTSLVRELIDDSTSSNSSGVDPEQTVVLPSSPSSMRSAQSTLSKNAQTNSVQLNRPCQPSSSAGHERGAATTTTTTVSDKHRTATPTPVSLAPTSSLSEATWWSHLLPYKASNLPTNLADRLRQRSSLVFSRPSSPQPDDGQSLCLSSQFLAHSQSCSDPPVQLTEMMTQSLYLQPSSESLLPPPLHQLQCQQPRRRVRTTIRPTSLCTERLYNQGGGSVCETFHLPSLAHLTSSTQSVNKNCACLPTDDSDGGSRGHQASVRPSSLALNTTSNGADTPSPPAASPPHGDRKTAAESSSSASDICRHDRKYANALSGSLTPALCEHHQNDSPVLGQYCRLLILHSADGLASPPTPTNVPMPSITPCPNMATNSEISTPSAGTDLTLIAASPHLFRI